jgi:hypothetical protein
MTAHPIDNSHIDVLGLTAGQIAKPLSPGDIAAQVEELLAGAPTGEGVA